MKRLLSFGLVVALLVSVVGCSAGSGATFGPVQVTSRVGVHELRPANFYTDPETGCVGSTLGPVSSEVCAQIVEREGAGLDAWVDWTNPDPFPETTPTE